MKDSIIQIVDMCKGESLACYKYGRKYITRNEDPVTSYVRIQHKLFGTLIIA